LNEIDDTPPEVLNLAVEVLEGGSLRVTWYSSEESTESIEVTGQVFTGDTVALRKNHDMTITPYPDLPALETHTLTVTVADASGNTNTSSVDFVIAEEDAGSPLPDPDQDSEPNDTEGEEENTNKGGVVELLAQPLVQIGLLSVLILVIVALIRTRKEESW
jgi:hypothetical protein